MITINVVILTFYIEIILINIFRWAVGDIILKYNINLINATLRYVNRCPNILTYCPRSMIAVVLYIDLNTNSWSFTDKCCTNYQQWTREIVDLVIPLNGTYYLPYHVFPTFSQFKKCYRQYSNFISMKENIDRNNLLTSYLWQFMRQ